MKKRIAPQTNPMLSFSLLLKSLLNLPTAAGSPGPVLSRVHPPSGSVDSTLLVNNPPATTPKDTETNSSLGPKLLLSQPKQ